jgi:tetratricopeptide (TPR) repeat protein
VFVNRLRRTVMSRWRLVTFAGCATTALGVLLCSWSDFCLWRADAVLNRRDHDAAATWVARSQWLSRGTDAQTSLLQLRIARRRRDFREVRRHLQEAAQMGAPPREIERQRLLFLAQSGQYREMQHHWAQLLSDQRDDGPEIAHAYYNWSMLNHHLSQAERTLKLWHEDYPRDVEPLALLGRYYEAQVNWEAAEDAYRRALTLAPASDEHRLSLAKALQNRLKSKEAVPLYEDYLRRHPDDATALAGLAQCAATNGDLATALDLLRRADQASPDDVVVQKAYGEMLLSAGDAFTAVVVLQRAHRAVPENANLANALARSLKGCGRIDEAEPLFTFVAESRPQLEKLNHLEKQLRREPDNLELRMEIASITANYVSRRDAMRWYQALLQVAPDYDPAHQALAELRRLTGDPPIATDQADALPRELQPADSTVTDSTRSGSPAR